MSTAAAQKQDLSAYWLPFSSNRNFKARPRMFVRAKGMHYYTDDGREVLDATAGLWCCGCGHSPEPVVKAVQEQVAQLDYVPAFQVGHPKVFELAERLAEEVFPGDLDRVLFTNSGSEAVDTALKLALAYHVHRGKAGKTLLIGRDRGYHGVNFGGISVGGIMPNRILYGNKLRTDHLPHTHDLSRNAFTRGLPAHGAELADALESIVKMHGAATIAAVIVEPVACSGGVLLPPRGYFDKLRAICDRHDILLIFDEVITAFGRCGAPTCAERLGVQPDMITFAKGVSSGVVPIGGVAVSRKIHDLFMDRAEGNAIDLFHGYTYSGHPLPCAASLAALDVYRDGDLFNRALALEDFWADALHSLRDCPHVIDIRNFGLVGAVELEPRGGAPSARAFASFLHCFHEENMLIRTTGDIIALSPPLIVSKEQIEIIVEKLGNTLRWVG